MDHRQIIASLSDQDRARLTQKSDVAGLAHLAVHWGAIAFFAGLIALRVPFWPVLMLPLGILLVFQFTLMHEAIHRTPFRSQWINDVVAWLCGLMLVLPMEWFRYFHFAHHRHTQDPDNDPELASAKPATISSYLWHVGGLPVWWGQVTVTLTNALGRNKDSFVPARGAARVVAEARVMIGIYLLLLVVSLWFQSPILLFIWIIPALLGQPFLRLYLLAEHGRCPMVSNMLENSRTTATNWLVRRLAWNMPYHAEHHSYPGVPFYRLPEFHGLIEAHLREQENGYVRFNAKYIAALAETNSPGSG